MERLKNIALVLFLALFIASLCFNVHHCITKQGGVFQDTVRTTFVDTIPYYKPVPRDSVVTRSVTQRLPVVDDKEDNFPNKSEQKSTLISELETQDSVTVQIPITQRVYETDRYRAVVSGYQPSLDDLLIYQPSQVVRIKDKPKRWGIGVQVGYGMTVKGTPQFAPYIGVGVSYNLFQF